MREDNPRPWRSDVEVLFTEKQIQDRIVELGEQIQQDCGDEPLVAVCILKGSAPFFTDLVRAIDLPLTCEFIGISSYGGGVESSGVVQITADLTKPIADRNILIVEDIVDTGLTMQYLIENFKTRGPRSVKVCTLLEKPDNAQTKVQIDYVGFRIPNEFVVGYGLDFAERYRNLPYIGVYRGEV